MSEGLMPHPWRELLASGEAVERGARSMGRKASWMRMVEKKGLCRDKGKLDAIVTRVTAHMGSGRTVTEHVFDSIASV